MYEKQSQRDKQCIRHPKEPEVKKHRYHSESKIESKPEAYYNYGYDESDGKPPPPKKKIKRNNVTYPTKKTMSKQKKEKTRMKVKARPPIER